MAKLLSFIFLNSYLYLVILIIEHVLVNSLLPNRIVPTVWNICYNLMTVMTEHMLLAKMGGDVPLTCIFLTYSLTFCCIAYFPHLCESLYFCHIK